MELAGQSAVVTGGGSGMGAASCRALAARGVKVAVIDVNQGAADAVAAEIGGLGLGCDVSDSTGVAAALARATEAHGTARIAVNCAGVATPGKIVGRDGPHDLDAFRRVIEINLIGTFNVLRLAAAGMTGLAPLDTGERGVVINTASIAAFEGQIGQSAYAASKGGVVGLTLPAARELARHGIRVVTIAPGLFGTPMVRNMPQVVQDSLAATIPFPHRLGEPDEFARLALHIIDNVMINGAVLRIDGALRMAPK